MKILKFHLSGLLALSIFFTSVVPQNVRASSFESYQISDRDIEIENVFNQFQYALTVEWDQVDVDFPIEAENKLTESLNALIARGVSADEIQRYMETHLLEGKVGNEYNRFLFALRSQGRSSEEITMMTTDFMSSNFNEGLSFNGEGGGGGRGSSLIMTVVVVVLVVAVTHLLFKKDKDAKPSCHKKHH